MSDDRLTKKKREIGVFFSNGRFNVYKEKDVLAAKELLKNRLDDPNKIIDEVFDIE